VFEISTLPATKTKQGAKDLKLSQILFTWHDTFCTVAVHFVSCHGKLFARFEGRCNRGTGASKIQLWTRPGLNQSIFPPFAYDPCGLLAQNYI